jgi:hypothetical protein
MQQQNGLFEVTGGELVMLPFAGGDGVATLTLAEPLPVNFETQFTFNADDASTGRFSNAFFIFDYHGPADFKFAGSYVGIDEWLIGHRNASGWVTDAHASAVIDPLTDYTVSVMVTQDGRVALSVGGVEQISHTFTGALTDGPIGLGTKNAFARFDDWTVEGMASPPAPTPGNLPIDEDFQDGIAQHFQVESGLAEVEAGRYHVTPFVGGDGISTLLVNGPLPAELEAQFVFNADPGSASRASNAFFIFDYLGPTNFKFAGAYLGIDEWLIGHRDASGWITDKHISAPIVEFTDYAVRVELLADSTVKLFAGGVEQVSHQFAGSLLDGTFGVGTKNALARYDDLVVQELTEPEGPAPGSLPLVEDFNDGVADHLQVIAGQATIAGGRYHVTPAIGGDGISTLVLCDAVPASVAAEFTFNADPGSANRSSNAFFIFDYQGPTDFKFAGAYVGIDEWLIGHRNVFGWATDKHVSFPLNANTDYTARVEVGAGGLVTLLVGGVPQVSHQFVGGSLADGAIGIGTKNAITRFDDLSFAALDEPGGPEPGTLPLAEDFDDGVADDFIVRSGAAMVSACQYHVSPPVGSDGISTVVLAEPLPAAFEAEVAFNANDATAEQASNAFFIFDYQSPTNFKFAGAYVGIDEWLIGHRDATGWVTDTHVSFSIDPNTDYTMLLEIGPNGLVKLHSDGELRVSLQYSENLLDGATGIGTKNAITRFDDYALREAGGMAAVALVSMVDSPATVTPRYATPGDGDFAENLAGFGYAAVDGLQRVAPALRGSPSGNVRAVAAPYFIGRAKDRVFDELGESGGLPGWMFPEVNRLSASLIV